MTNLLAAEGSQSVAAASGVFTLSWLLIALPLAGALVLLVGGRRTDRIGHLVGTAMPAAARHPGHYSGRVLVIVTQPGT